MILELREYLDREGRNPFAAWFADLDSIAAAKITTALTRMSLGHLSNTKGVGESVLEYKVDFGPGYRVYFGRDGERVVILVAGGTKRRQVNDVRLARLRWADYKARKRGS